MNLLQLMLAFPPEIRLQIYSHMMTESVIRTVHWVKHDDFLSHPLPPTVTIQNCIQQVIIQQSSSKAYEKYTNTWIRDWLQGPAGPHPDRHTLTKTSLIKHDYYHTCRVSWSCSVPFARKASLQPDRNLGYLTQRCRHDGKLALAERTLRQHVEEGLDFSVRGIYLHHPRLGRRVESGWSVESDFGGSDFYIQGRKIAKIERIREPVMVCRVKEWEDVQETGVLDHNLVSHVARLRPNWVKVCEVKNLGKGTITIDSRRARCRVDYYGLDENRAANEGRSSCR